MGTDCVSGFELRILMGLAWATGTLALAAIYFVHKRMNQWKKAAEDWRVLAQQYSNAAFAERMARMQLAHRLAEGGVDAPDPLEQKQIVH